MCSPNTLKLRFGNYREIYETIGYRPVFRDFYKGPRAESSLRIRRDLVEQIRSMFPEHVEVTQQRMRARSILWVDDSFYVAVLLCQWVQATKRDRAHWVVCPNPSEHDYITLVCLLSTASDRIVRFYLFPLMNFLFRRAREGHPWLDTGRKLKSLNEFYEAVKTIRRAAC
jgi:hypothetical protein